MQRVYDGIFSGYVYMHHVWQLNIYRGEKTGRGAASFFPQRLYIPSVGQYLDARREELPFVLPIVTWSSQLLCCRFLKCSRFDLRVSFLYRKICL